MSGQHVIITRSLLVLVALSTLLRTGGVGAGELYDRDSARESALLAAGAAVGGGALWVNAGLQPLSSDELEELDREGLPRFDRFATRRWSPTAATMSDVLLYGSAAAPLLLFTETGRGMDDGDLGLMYAETLLLQNGLTALVKGLVRRPRPFAYNGDPSIPEELRRSQHTVRSFPSGHTSTAFAAAVFAGEVYARLHPDDPSRHWVRGGGLVAAAATAWLRVAAGRHFPSDVVAGAALGALVGWAVPRMHEVEPDGSGASGGGPMLVFGLSF